MKKAILFDIDGTLLDTRDFVFGSVRNSIAVHKLPAVSDSKLKKVCGKALVEFYGTLFPGVDPSKLSKTHREFQENNFNLIKIFPKTKKTLQILKKSGFLLAAVSNRMRESLVHSLKLAGIFDYFDTVVCADDVINPKPHREHLLTALLNLKIGTEDVYMVGDTENDILAGKNAKIETVGVTYGWLGKDIAKHNPDYVIDDIEELLEIVG